MQKNLNHPKKHLAAPATPEYSTARLGHDFHMVTPSPWPFLASWALFLVVLFAAAYMHGYASFAALGLALALTTVFAGYWLGDVVYEATILRQHSLAVQRGLRLGFALFIVSEIMFFFGLFWAFFHSSLAPAIQIGGVWPPKGITPFDPFGVPLFNTFLLLTSGAAVTWAHYALLTERETEAAWALATTIFLGLSFTLCQIYEYATASFSIHDSVYGSVFYVTTGFHGMHVLVGSIFLAVCLYRTIQQHFESYQHVGFEAAAWYWHFVDVVWLFVFVSIYWWGN